MTMLRFSIALGLAVGVLAALAPVQALASGVSNGAIQGVVYAAGGQPLSGASVVAVRDEEPKIIRSAVSDEMGNFYLPSLYVGTYTLGFSKFGFKTITTQEGDPRNRTALGSQVRSFVEPGRVSVVPSVTMFAELGALGGTVNVQVSDAVTGEPVEDASVIVGAAAASGPAAGGRYVLIVPSSVDQSGNLQPVRAIVQADGFETQQSVLTLVPGAAQNAFFRLSPTRALIMGTVRLGFGIPSEELLAVRVVVENVDPALASGRVVDSAGNFEVTVPASTATRTRTFNLLFLLNNTRVARLTNVIAPRAGARSLPQPVPVEPLTATVAGQVVLSDGTVPGGFGYDRAIVLELGRAFPIVNGAFSIPGIPLGRAFNIQVEAMNPRTRLVELGQSRVMPISDGTSDPVFRLPLIVTGRTGLGAFPTPF